MGRFYAIANSLFEDKAFAYAEHYTDDYNVGEAEYCQTCQKPISSLEWLPPFDIKLSKPSFGDFVFGTINPFLVSKYFKQEYDKGQLVGINSFELVNVKKVLRNKSEIEAPIFYLPKIIRSRTAIDEKKSKFKREKENYCCECRTGGIIKSFDGIYFEEETIGGEDIFYARGLPGVVFVSEKFKDFIEGKEFTNIFLEKVEEYKPRF